MYHKTASEMGQLIGIITEGESSEIYRDMLQIDGPDGIQQWFLDRDLLWTSVVEEDVIRVLCGMNPIHFLSDFTYVDLYRAEHGVYVEPHEGGFVSFAETSEIVSRHLDAVQKQLDHFGVGLWQYGHGYACPAEANFFYESAEWQRKAKTVRYAYGYHCAICKRQNVVLHAHHNTPIMSAYHYNFHLNFADYKLEALCEDCHRRFHSKTVRGCGHYGFHFADTSEIADEKRKWRLLKRAHDELRVCPFCFEYQPDWYKVYINWPDIEQQRQPVKA